MSMTTTNIDTGSVEISGGEFRDETMSFGGADTIAPGTILARRKVATAVTASAVTGTGDGTVTAAVVVDGPVVPLVGAYVLTCTAAVTNGGVWQLTDPNGAIVATGLTMTAGVGAATVFETAGLRFTITDGANNFVAGDTATLTVAADGKLVPFATDGVGGAQYPVAVLTYEVVATGSGNKAVRPLIAGMVNQDRLIIDADGDGSNVTTAIIDQLRAIGIVAHPVRQLAGLDNQPS